MAAEPAAPEITARTQGVIDALIDLEGPLLPILHGIQAEFGCVPAAALPQVALALNISRAEAHGVATFYHDFRTHPPGRHVLKLCSAEACQAMGGAGIASQVRDALGIGFGETAADGSVTLEPVYCLGLCACAPAAMLDGRVVGRLDAAKAAALVAGARA